MTSSAAEKLAAELEELAGRHAEPAWFALEAIEALADDAGAIFEEAAVNSLIWIYQNDQAEFARCRDAVKKSGKVKMTDFDALVKSSAKQTSDSSVIFPEEVMWPVPVEGAMLLSEIKATINRFVIADDPTITAAALWSVFTWTHHLVQVSPIAHITAPEKRCGKSVLLECLTKLSCRALPASSISPAALYRCVEAWEPTLLIDEADSFMRDNEDLRGIVNSGFNKSAAFVIRCDGDDNEPAKFSTWAAKALCGIGRLPATIEDRAIPLILRRKRPGETVEKLRRTPDELWRDLRSKILRWVSDNQAGIKKARPAEIGGLNDRAQDAWEPLLQIAEIAGGDWPRIARNAAIRIHGVEGEALSSGAELLRDIRDAFSAKGVDRLLTRELIDALCEDDEAPWSTCNRGKEIIPRQLSQRLSEYKIKPTQIRTAFDNGRGYRLDDFKDAFARYIPAEGDLSVTTLQASNGAAYSEFEKRYNENNVTQEKTLKASSGAACNTVTDKNAPPEHQDPDAEVF